MDIPLISFICIMLCNISTPLTIFTLRLSILNTLLMPNNSFFNFSAKFFKIFFIFSITLISSFSLQARIQEKMNLLKISSFPDFIRCLPHFSQYFPDISQRFPDFSLTKFFKVRKGERYGSLNPRMGYYLHDRLL